MIGRSLNILTFVRQDGAMFVRRVRRGADPQVKLWPNRRSGSALRPLTGGRCLPGEWIKQAIFFSVPRQSKCSLTSNIIPDISIMMISRRLN